MASYLDETGLAYFWSKLKTLLAGKLSKAGDTMTGNLTVGSAKVQTNGYLIGTWLQITADNHLASTPEKFSVQDGSGWLYYRTGAELMEDLGVPAAIQSAVNVRASTSAYGTTKLSTSVTSTSKTTAATPYAVKTALDKAKAYCDDAILTAINTSY